MSLSPQVEKDSWAKWEDFSHFLASAWAATQLATVVAWPQMSQKCIWTGGIPY